jgi:NAD(P)-dependent dehydrogenase (short-subunit alcohol dehydrogenase family)/acyl carrier protein
VLPVAADVADRAQLAAAVAAARERFGALHGVFHLAGNTRPDQLMVSVETTDPETCRRHFASKAYGLYALDAALADEKLDFRVLFSSLSTVPGGLGFSAYAAANAFLDGFAQAMPGWLSIDWDGFRRTEEAGGREDTTMAPSQAGEALHRLLGVTAARRAVVAVSDLETRLDRWVRLAPTAPAPERAAEEAGAEAAPGFGRPALATPYVAPQNETEENIAEVWRDLLGIAEIGIHDNFFELGGDSLLATQLISRLRRALHVELPLQVFFQLPTVAQLAARLGQGAYRQEELSEIEAMLAEIKELSPEEEAALLAELEAEEGKLK